MKRRLFSIISTGFFAVMMALLTRDHLWPMITGTRSTPVSTAEIADIWNGKDEWVAVSINGARIGIVHNLVRRSEEGFEAYVRALIQAPLVGSEIKAAARLNHRLELEQVRVTLDRSTSAEPALVLGGLVESGDLLLRLSSSSGVRHSKIALRGPLTINVAADPLMARGDLAAGQVYSIDVYDPLWGMKAGRLKFELQGLESLEIEGERVETRVVKATMDNIVMRAWMDGSDQAVRREITIGTPGADAAGQESEGLTVVLEQVRAPESLPNFEYLRELPELPDYEAADLKGEDKGQPLEALGFFPMMLQRMAGLQESMP